VALRHFPSGFIKINKKDLKTFFRGSIAGFFCSPVPIAQFRLADIPFIFTVLTVSIFCGIVNVFRYHKFSIETNKKDNSIFIKKAIMIGSIVHITLQTSIGESITTGICGGVLYACLNHAARSDEK